MKNFIGVFLTLLLLQSCQTALKMAYGIKEPKLESEQSVKEYLLRKKMDTSNVFVFKNLYSFLAAGQKKVLNIPEAMFFNKDGNLVRYKKEAEVCNAKVDEFLADLTAFSSMQEDTTFTMDELFGMLDGKPVTEKADVNVVITWTVYAGRLNKTKAFQWVKLLEKAKANGIHVNYYLLNCDYQKSWNMPKEVLDKLGIKE